MKDFSNIVSYSDLADYLTAEYGHDLAVFDDGSVEIIESATVYKTGGPIARAKCPGIGNLDSSVFTDGFVEWDDENGAYVVVSGPRIVGGIADVIRECCRDGDVTDFYDDLVAALEGNARQGEQGQWLRPLLAG